MKNFAQLSQVINAGSATEDMLTAFFGSRKSFHRSIGIKLLGTKAINLLTNYPINLDPFSNQSNLILKALAFTELYKLGSWDLYSRWLQSNIASITEKALFNLNKIDQRKTKELVKIRLLDTHISDSSRRVLMRYYLRHSIH